MQESSQGLCLVEIDAADRPVVLFEAVDQGSHPVVPQLDRGGVQRYEDPWPARRSASEGGALLAPRYLLGWKAMPLAREDLDSNWRRSALYQRSPWR